MLLDIETSLLLFFGFFIIATFYSSVGFGGGSSYLALLSLFAFSFFFIRSNALICNLLVVSGSTYLFYKNGHFSIRDFLPFIITSIPMAFIGALFKLEEKVFFILLGVTLILSAISLFYQALRKSASKPKVYPKYMSYVLGAGIGLLSGLVGVGGGIFLAPLLNHLRWGKPVKIAALAAFFILVNSASGLVGLFVSGTLEISWSTTLVLLVAVVLGGQLGVRFSLKKASPKAIRIGTAILVLLVGLRILINRAFY
jgi:uncharacterized membrane protein YfcA